MKHSKLRKCINQYQEIGNQIAALEKQKEVIAERIKRHMGDNDVGRILRTFKIKKNVEVTDNGKIII